MTRNLTAVFIADGYLYGATDHPNASDPRYWGNLRYEGGFALVELLAVPDDLADALEAMGTSEQTYGDGYEAATVAAPYVGRTIYAEGAGA